MASEQDSEATSSELPLPADFEKIEDILNMPSERLQKNPLVNVIGLLKDYQPPVKTKGSDFKCTLTIMDLSTQCYSDLGIKVMIFWPEEKMPLISGVCDIVHLRQFKVQMWSGYISLLANWSSAMQVFPAAKMPPWPVKLSTILSSWVTPSKITPPPPIETEYAAWLFHHVNRDNLPDKNEFLEQSARAMVVREKYSLLKDIKVGFFYDLIGEVIQVYERDGRATLYLSDYTAHSLFYNNEWGGGGNAKSSARDGDEYGYTKPRKRDSNDWPGPYGKLSLQVTAYDSHAAYIREQVKSHDWVILRNVQVKMGNIGGFIEGFLRGDQRACEGKVQVQIIRRAEDAERNDVRWKDGLRRKLEWWDKFEKQKQAFLEEARDAGGKRKLDDMEVSKNNSKKRRNALRAAAEQKVAVTEKRAIETLNLNSNVKCNHPDKPPTPLAQILNATYTMRSNSGSEFLLPFQNVKYRSNVRVIDFWPNKLEDFAVGRRVSEYEVLSDYSGGEGTDKEEDTRLFRQGKGYGGQKTWEWRFALRVEDAKMRAKSHKETMWLIVDNQAAQMLLKMDAMNLRQDKEALSVLREVLFRLWGDLEEKKSAYLEKQNDGALKAARHSTGGSTTADRPDALSRKLGDDLPPDSDDEDSLERTTPSKVVSMELDPNIGPDANQELSESMSLLPVTNKGFTCCIKQYGIKVPEELRSRADAGEGVRWKRVFGLFGTMIT